MIDDEPVNTATLGRHLERAGYTQVAASNNAAEAMELINRNPPDLLLLDIVMPPFCGLDILAEVRQQYGWMPLPVIILTAETDRNIRRRALDLGATDFLSKPVDSVELLLRVRNALIVKAHHDILKSQAETLEAAVHARTATLVRAQEEIIHCLAQAAEYRDTNTGRHVIRVGKYAGILARELKLPDTVAALIEQAAPLHDVGKIGVPDHILLKPGKLTPEEFETMREHCRLGQLICEPVSTEPTVAQLSARSVLPVLRLASEICLSHHEKWDGTGYPQNLHGDQIPLAARITAVADVFDALTSQRPYKPPLPLKKCINTLKEGRGNHFDPAVIDAFLQALDHVLRVYVEYADDAPTAIANVVEFSGSQTTDA